MLRSDLCDYSNGYIVIKGTIAVEEDNDNKTRNKKLFFKNNASLRSCISKTNNTFVENAEAIYVVMPVHNLLKYSDNYSMTSESWWNYYRDEINDDAIENDNANNDINKSKTITSKAFEYKTKITEKTLNGNNTLHTEFVVPLKYLNNFSRFLDFPLINCEI